VRTVEDRLPLQTERLELREFEESDLDAIHAYASDPEVVRYMAWGPNTPEQTREFLHAKLAEQRGGERRAFGLAVVERQSGALIGSVGLRLNESGTQAALGYCFSRRVWGQGYATEAAGAMLRFGFEELGLHRIHATCDPRDVASARVLEKIGMRREGHFVQQKRQKGRWRDSYCYAILRREWEDGSQPVGERTRAFADAIRACTLFNSERARRWKGAYLDIPEGVEVRMEVPYGSGGDVELTTDLFLPPREFTDPRPAMLYIHGGGWRAGSPTQFYRHAARLAEKGVVGSCCRYRFAPEFTFPAAVHDVKAAVRALRASAEELNIDGRRIGVLGGSAGGHLAAILATTAGIPELDGDAGHAEQPGDVQLGVLLNPVTDMTAFVRGTNLHPAALQFMGAMPEEIPEAYKLASPLLHIDANTPPCLLVHGAADTTVPCDQSAMFAGAMKSRGLRADLILVDGVGHGFFNSDPHYEVVYSEIESFVLEVLSP